MKRRCWNRRERGAVAVEFALVLPILLLLVLAGIDWGYYFFAGQIVANAAREGARVGALTRSEPPSETDLCDGISGDLANNPGAKRIAVNYLVAARLITGAGDSRLTLGCHLVTVSAANDAIEVSVSYQANHAHDSMSLTGYLPAGFLPRFASAVATMRREP